MSTIPDDLKQHDNWVLWRYQGRNGKRTKVPYCVYDPTKHADTSDPQTWDTYASAERALRELEGTSRRADGLGRVFSASDGLCGVDFDNCLGPDGAILPWAQPYVRRLAGSYCEISPSGRGLKFWVRAELPGRGSRKTGFGPDGSGAIEVYDCGRYFTVTGHLFDPEWTTVEDRREAISALYQEIAPKPSRNGREAPGGPPLAGDDDLLARARKAKNGRAFADLYEGRFPTEITHSEADFRLCCHLAFWFHRDPAAIDRVFRASQLMRDKWDERRGDSTYGAITIDKAIGMTTEVYTPRAETKDNTPDVAEVVATAGTFTKFSEVLLAGKFLEDCARLPRTDTDLVRQVLEETLDRKFKAREFRRAVDARRPKPSGPAPAKDKDERRPRIEVRPEVHEMVEEAVDALAGHPGVFQRTTSPPVLVELVRVVKPPKKVRKAEGTPEIMAIPNPRLEELLSQAAAFVHSTKDEDGELEARFVQPPGNVVAMVSDRRDWPGIRPLASVTECPTLRDDGSLLQTPGYDPDSGIMYLPHADFPAIPASPTHADARAAADFILNVVKDFRFKDGVNRCAWLAGFLTPFAMDMIDDKVPAFLVEASTAGAGKSLLCDIISIASTGREMPRTSYTNDDDEMRKVLFSLAMAGYRILLLDNITNGGSVGGRALDMIVTARAIRERILGVSRMAEVDWRVPVFLTGNNLRTRGDFRRRVVHCRLEPIEDRPEEREDFEIKDLLAHVRGIRAELVVAALTILRAFVVAGTPAQKLKPMDFPRWCRAVRDTVHWATGIDPCAARAELASDDETEAFGQAVVVGWEALCRDLGKTAVTTAEAVAAMAEFPATKHDALRQTFLDHAGDGKPLTAHRVGLWLRNIRDRVFAGKKIVRAAKDKHDEVIRWGVELVAQSLPSAGNAGIAGNHSSLRGHENEKFAQGACANFLEVGEPSLKSLPAMPALPADDEETRRTPTCPGCGLPIFGAACVRCVAEEEESPF